LLLIVLATALPSIYLAARLVDNELFSSKARAFSRKEFQAAQVHVIETKVAPGTREIEVTLIGPRLPAAAVHAIEGRLPLAGLQEAHLIVHQAENTTVDVGSLKSDILAEIVRSSQQAQHDQADTIAALRARLATLDAWPVLAAAVAREFAVQFPHCQSVLVGRAVAPDKTDATLPTLLAECRPLPGRSEMERLRAWLRVRTNSQDARLILSAPVRLAKRAR
jgi:hypothetical protein